MGFCPKLGGWRPLWEILDPPLLFNLIYEDCIVISCRKNTCESNYCNISVTDPMIRRPGREGGEKHESYVAAFDGHLFMTCFTWPGWACSLAPPDLLLHLHSILFTGGVLKLIDKYIVSITNSDEAIPRYDEEWKNLVNPEETGSGNRSDVTLKGLLLAQMIVAVLSFVVLQMVTGSLISLKRA